MMTQHWVRAPLRILKSTTLLFCPNTAATTRPSKHTTTTTEVVPMGNNPSSREPSTTFIDRLPIEMLCRVLYHVCAPPSENHYQNLHTLAQVCKTWARLIQESPQFWSYHDAEPTTGKFPSLPTILAKSKNHCLVIKNHYVGCDRLNAALFNEMHRWKSIHFLVPSTEGEFEQWLWHEPAPVLEKVQIWNAGGDDRSQVPDLFGGQAPKLKHLEVAGLWFSPSLPALRGLRTLKISDVRREKITFFQFLKTLEDHPSLENLRMAFCDFLQDPSEKKAGNQLCLPKLKSFTLYSAVLHDIQRALVTVNMPLCSRMRFDWIPDEAADTTSLTPSLICTPYAMPTFKRILLGSESVVVTLKEAAFTPWSLAVKAMTGGKLSASFEMSIESEAFGHLKQLAEVLDLPGVGTSIHAIFQAPTEDVIAGASDADALVQSLLRMPSLKRLDLHNLSLPTLHAVLDTLGARYDGLQWVCPNLEELFILGLKPYSGSKILDMIRHRYKEELRAPTGSLAMGATLTGAGWPRPLRKLLLQRVLNEPEDRRLLEDALGSEGTLVWDPMADFRENDSSDYEDDKSVVDDSMDEYEA